MKLFGWEPDFIKKVDDVFQEELEIEDKQHLRQKVYDVIEGILSKGVSITTFGVYIWLGNTLTISKLVLTSQMLSQLEGRIGITQRYYRLYFEVI